MKYHTEGTAGSEELNEEKVAAVAQRVAPELQATFVDRKLNEVRLGQRKEPSILNLDLTEDEGLTNQSVEDGPWKGCRIPSGLRSRCRPTRSRRSGSW